MIKCDLPSGTRVVLTIDHPDDNPTLIAGCAGRVCRDWSYGSGYWVSVDWDMEVERGHDCDGRCADGYGWNVPSKFLELEPDKEYEIDAAAIPNDYDLLSFICE